MTNTFPTRGNKQASYRRNSRPSFCADQDNRDNLVREGVDESKIYITGNTVIDALKTTVVENYDFANEGLKKLDFKKRIITVTAHRREISASLCTIFARL